MTNDEIKDRKASEEAAGEQANAKAPEEDKDEAQAEKPAEEKTEEKDQSSEDKEKAEDDGDKALNELNKKYMLLAAEFQNFKRRTREEKSDIYKYGTKDFALDIIEVIDNFERALAHIEDCQDKQFAEGVEKIYKQLENVLEKNNIEAIKAEGEPFDPNFHEAMLTTASDDYDSGVVVKDMQKGYTLNGRVIRPTKVMVSE